MEYLIRKMRPSDLACVYALECKSFNDPWTVKQFEYEISENPISHQFVIEINQVVIGFIVFWITFNSSTICKIAINKEFQKEGFGTSLLSTMFSVLNENAVETVTLEVNVNNTNAIKFYTKNGFSTVTIKKQYYVDGSDAYYMVKVLL